MAFRLLHFVKISNDIPMERLNSNLCGNPLGNLYLVPKMKLNHMNARRTLRMQIQTIVQ